MAQPTTIIWDLNCGGSIAPIANTVVANPLTNTNPNGDTFLLHFPPEPVLDGFNFGGWWAWDSYGVLPQEIRPSFPVCGDDNTPMSITLHAMWLVPVTLNPNGGLVAPIELEYLVGEYFYDNIPTKYGATLPLPSRPGYEFAGWWTGLGSVSPSFQVASSSVVTAEAHTLYAHWRAGGNITVYFAPNGGTLVASPASITYTPPCTYGNLPNATRSGYAFQGWFNAPVGGIQVQSDWPVEPPSHTLFARWTDNIGAVVTFIANGGVITGSNVVAYERGACYGAFVPVSRAGYSLLGWYTGLHDGYPVLADHPVGTTDHYLYAQWMLGTIPDEDTLFVSTDGWVPVTLPKLYASLPPAIKMHFDTWLGNTGSTVRMLRLGLVLEGVVSDVRTAADADNNEVGKLVANSVPVSCLRHVLCTVWYNIAIESGMEYAKTIQYRAGWMDANIFLRSLFLEARMGVFRFAPKGVCSVWYSGAAGSVPSGAAGSGGIGSGGINSSPPVSSAVQYSIG